MACIAREKINILKIQNLFVKECFYPQNFVLMMKNIMSGFHSVIIQKDKDYDLKYLLGLLNSSFGKNWFNTNGKKRGVGVDIGVSKYRNSNIYANASFFTVCIKPIFSKTGIKQP